MPGYFDKRRSLKSLTDYTRNGIQRLKQVITKQELKAEEYRSILFNPEFMSICNQPSHPKFRETEAIKQNAFYLLGETKYLLYESKQKIIVLSRRQKLYEKWMQPLID